jgi:hypothetical protein
MHEATPAPTVAAAHQMLAVLRNELNDAWAQRDAILRRAFCYNSD